MIKRIGSSNQYVNYYNNFIADNNNNNKDKNMINSNRIGERLNADNHFVISIVII